MSSVQGQFPSYYSNSVYDSNQKSGNPYVETQPQNFHPMKLALTSEQRQTSYTQKLGDYKYNIYSLIDEPWNRCCDVGRCGSCGDNQCIASRTPRMDWI